MDADPESSVPASALRARSVTRLAELVAELCGCTTAVARDAVMRVHGPDAPAGTDEALAVVARAMIHVREGDHRGER